MKNKIILILLSTLVTVSMIGCSSKEEQTTNSTYSKATVSADEDVEIKKDYGEDIELVSKKYLKPIDSNTKIKHQSGKTIRGRVTEDKDNHSKVESFDKSKNGKTLICYLDTTGSKDLTLGDVVIIVIEYIDKDDDDDSDGEPAGFRHTIEPISSIEYNKKVSERVGDTRDKSTKDNYSYLKDTKENSYFAPELSMAMYKDMLPLRTTTAVHSKDLSTIQGIYDGEVVLIDIENRETMLVATKVNEVYEYFCVNIGDQYRATINNKNYKIGDRVKVTIGTVENQEIAISIE